MSSTSKNIEIPVLGLNVHGNRSIGGPASVAERIRDAAGAAVQKVVLDLKSIDESVSALGRIVEIMQGVSIETIALDTVSFQLGVSVAGKVGFMGSGAEVQLATQFQVSFRIK